MNPDRDLLLRFVQDPLPAAMPTSALLEALDARLEGYVADEKRLTMSFAPPTTLRQGAGVVQGGALSMMLDFVLAFSGMAAVGTAGSVATVSLGTDFMGTARGDRIMADGVVEKAGRSMVFARGWLMDGGKKVATAQSTLMVVSA